MNLLYKLPTRYTYQTAETDNPPCGAFRGWGSPQSCYFHERVINKACEDLGFDPVEVRSKAHIVTGFNGAASVGVEDCLRQGAAKFGWSSKWKPFKNKTDTGTVKSGVGCGIGVHTTGATTTNTSAAILMNRDGTAVLQTAASEMGTGVITVLAMIAAEELGAKLEDVSVDSGSSFLPECATQSATRTTHTLGKAVQLAADDLKQQLFTIAAGILGVSSSALSSKNSAIFVTADPTKTVAFKDVVAKGLRSIIGHGVRPATASPNHSEVYYADFVELQVDTETGDVNIVNFIAAHDVGKVVNLNTLENQVEGGTMEALGYSLAEEVVTDAASGVPLTCSYLNYGLYPVDQTPQLSVLFIESNDPYGPFGAKGIGEAPMNAPAATISSAIYNAIGKWIDPPFTPAKVLKALGKA